MNRAILVDIAGSNPCTLPDALFFSVLIDCAWV